MWAAAPPGYSSPPLLDEVFQKAGRCLGWGINQQVDEKATRAMHADESKLE
jgi:hypothetical protein